MISHSGGCTGSLALPAGVLSDAFDRRWLLFATQAYVIVVAAVMAVLAAAGRMTPGMMLTLMFAAGVGLAFQVPTWQPLIAELVPRSQLAAATRLDMVSVNVARAAGPAIAGLIIAAWGVPPVFGFTAVCSAVLATILLAWRRPEASLSGDRERFLPALRAGGRYVRHEPVVRVILGRLAMFVAPAAALWALLPLIASQGPVQVIVEYHVPPDRETDWLSAMQAMRRSRLRSGAFRWELYRVGERPDRFVEIFAVPSWAEHERQHQHRLTAEDQAIEEAAFAHTTTTPRAEHLRPPQSRADQAP